jgi:glutathione reductase (NADPH)
MTARYDFDLFVIGAGSGGVRSARMAADLGARVAVAEQDRFGGTCVIRGCIPKKFFVYASAFPEEFEDAAGYGWTVGDNSFDWPTLIANKDHQIARLEGLYRRAVERPGGTIFDDRAVIKDRHTLHLVRENRDVTAGIILVATGGHPSRNIGAPGAEYCITSDEAFELKTLPESIVVAGGGYIALEFANIFNGLGVKVTLLHRGPKVLRGFDEDLRDAVQETMRKKGITLLLNTGFSLCESSGPKTVRVLTTGGDSMVVDKVMLAIGRNPNTAGLGLCELGVDLTPRGHIAVDAYSRTSVDNIYAVGDVTGRLELTPVAIHEAMCFVKTAFGGVPTAPDHELVATAVYTRPEIGTVGLTEDKALERGHTIDLYKTTFLPLKHTLSGRNERMLMKLVVDAKTDKVLGCHIFGPEAGEMAQLVAIALKMGATKAQFDATVAVHPTMAEELVTMRVKTATRTPSGALS